MIAPLFAISTLGLIVLIVVLLLVFGSFPLSRRMDWGYAPSGILGAIFVILLVLVLFDLVFLNVALAFHACAGSALLVIRARRPYLRDEAMGDAPARS